MTNLYSLKRDKAAKRGWVFHRSKDFVLEKDRNYEYRKHNLIGGTIAVTGF
jgi:hypothetical protein